MRVEAVRDFIWNKQHTHDDERAFEALDASTMRARLDHQMCTRLDDDDDDDDVGVRGGVADINISGPNTHSSRVRMQTNGAAVCDFRFGHVCVRKLSISTHI